MKELLENINEFLASGEDNLKKKRFNAAITDFFKSIIISCDYLIYTEIKLIPKNHNQRFSLLSKYFQEIYTRVSELFVVYTKSYNLRLDFDEAIKFKEYSNELKNIIRSKK